MLTDRITVRVATMLLALLGIAGCGPDVTAPERMPEARGVSLLATSNTWTLRAPMPTPRSSLKAVTVNGIVYAIGGYGYAPNVGGNLIRPKVEAYNTATNTWTTKTGLPEPLEPTGATTVNGKIYVAGGPSNERISKALYVYNPATNLWARKRDMPYKGTRLGGNQVAINGLLYVYFGVTTNPDGTAGPQRFLRYNPSTNTWTSLKPPSFARVGAISGVYNGRLYLLRGQLPLGFVAGGGRAYDVHVYNPSSGWTKLPQRGSLGIAYAYATTGGKLYFTGSFFADGWAHIDAVYDPATNTTTDLTPSRFTREYAAGAGANGKFYVIGGVACQEVSGEGDCNPSWDGLTGAVEAYTP